MESLTENWEKITELFANDVPFAYNADTGIVLAADDEKEGDE